ncbi:MAG: ATP-binding cassette domain-containing protein [Muribaculaceae bacterium]
MTHNINHIQTIRLRGLLPAVFDNAPGRERFASSGVMLGDVALECGKTYCLNASSGTGKTSLCGFIYGSRRDYLGNIFFDDLDARAISVEQWCELRRRHLAFLPQELGLFAELSVMDNIKLKNRLTDTKSQQQILQMLDRLGVADLADRLAGQISVGQQQRVALVRALCQPFDFILLDEPVSHLDAFNNKLCADLILEEAARYGAAIIFTSVGNPLSIKSPVIPLNL